MDIKKKIKSKKKLFLIVISMFVIVITSGLNVSAAHIGVSPSKLYFNDVLRGGYSEKNTTITIDTQEPSEVSIEPRGEITEWINLSNQDFEISRDSPGKLRVSITPPSDTPNGNYTGYLRVMLKGSGETVENHAVGIVKTAIELSIVVEVTDEEYLECRASEFKIISAEKGDDVLVKLDVLNEGNIRLNPRVIIDIWNQEQSEKIDTIEYSEKSIRPTKEEPLIIEIPTKDIEIGQYWADISAVDCYNSKFLTFDVFEPGSLKANGVLQNIITKTWAQEGETIPIEVLFKNTGEKNLDAQFKGKITHSNKIIQLLESEKLNVEIDKETSFPFYFTPSNPGKYIISGRVFYDNKRTYEKSAIVNVKPSGIKLSEIITTSIYGILLFFILILIFKIHQERKKINSKMKMIK